MAALATTNPTLLDLAKRSDPDGKIATIAEILNETNEILDDMTWIEGNLPTGYKTTVRTGLPAPTWRKLYGGVQPTKSTTAQVVDSCGMLEAYSEIDVALAELSNDIVQFKLSESKPHMEGMSQELAQTLFYGNESTEPEAFTGLAPRFNSTSAENGSNILTGGGSSSCTSVWLIVWSDQTCHGIVPKGSTAGLRMSDKGQVTIEDVNGNNGGRMEAYRTHFRWDAGLTVRDWRYVVRIPNIDVTALKKDAATGADLIDLMMQATELVPNLGAGRPVFYCNRVVRSYLKRQIKNDSNVRLTQDDITRPNGLKTNVPFFEGIPVRRCDAILNTESAVS